MDKKSFSFRLSKKTAGILERQAKRLRVSKTAALDWMINDFTESSAEEKEAQRTQRQEALQLFLSTHKDSSIELAWRAGFNTGWIQFQTRKFTSPFRGKPIDSD